MDCTLQMRNLSMNKKTTALIAFGSLLIFGLWLAFAPCSIPDAGILSMPRYINSVFPRPETTISFSCYNKRNFSMFVSGPARGALQSGGIIVDMRPMFLFEWEMPQGSDDEGTQFHDRVFLYVDGRVMEKTWDWLAGGEVIKILPDGTEVESNLPGWYRFGSNPFLLPGDHTAKVVIETLSGETLEYEWQFTITFP